MAASTNESFNNETSPRNFTNHLSQIWGFSSVATLAIFVSVLVTNGAVLIMFLKVKQIRTSFSVYLINLMLCNIIYAVLQNPLELLDKSYSKWWMGKSACSLYIYATIVSDACIKHCHVLITINRLWAMTFPIFYRQHHSTKRAIIFCLLTVVYVYIFLLPDTLTMHCTFGFHLTQWDAC